MNARRIPVRYTMYGAEFWLHPGKLRAYLRDKRIGFEARTPTLLTYRRFIVPRTGVRFIPLLHTPDDHACELGGAANGPARRPGRAARDPGRPACQPFRH